MRKAKTLTRDEAIRHGLKFIYRTACDEESFNAYGHDYLGCFHCIESTSKDSNLSNLARQIGQERARHWRSKNAVVPPDADATMIVNLIFGTVAANHFGIRDKELKPQIQRAIAKFTARDYFGFDPLTEAPPSDVPETCKCGADNPRGRKTCLSCKKRLEVISRYGVYIDALTRSYFAERLGVRLGARYLDVIKWLPAMRPYRGREQGGNPDFYYAIYAVTHVVYTLNGYSLYKLSPRWLPDEYEFLRANLVEAIAMEDPETMGEFLDALKAFGLSENHPLIRKGMNYLLATQNADGSWGEVGAEDIYGRYHPTWTAIDGLREYAWRGERLHFPKFMGAVKSMSRSKGRLS
jgi:squalene-hopene cyclase-like protein